MATWPPLTNTTTLPAPVATARGPAGLNLESVTPIANLAAYAALPTDRNIVITAMNGPLVITLPLASVFTALNDGGRPIHILDMSGVCSNVNTITVQTQGGDLINGAASVLIAAQWSSVHMIVMSSTTWNADGTANTRAPWMFAQHSRGITIPSAVWTPIALNTNQADPTNMHPVSTFTTTIAAASNGAILPQATVNVVSTTGALAAGGYATITIAGVDTIIKYTGFVLNTSLTGCTLGVGTLATGQAVNGAYETLAPTFKGIYAAVGQITWAANPTGQRGVRIFGSGVFAVGQTMVPTTNSALQSICCFGQPQIFPAGPIRVEAYQDSGAALTATNDGIQAPSLGAVFMTPV